MTSITQNSKKEFIPETEFIVIGDTLKEKLSKKEIKEQNEIDHIKRQKQLIVGLDKLIEQNRLLDSLLEEKMDTISDE